MKKVLLTITSVGVGFSGCRYTWCTEEKVQWRVGILEETLDESEGFIDVHDDSFTKNAVYLKRISE